MRNKFMSILTIVIAFICCFGLVGCKDNSENEKPLLGVWWWSKQLGDEYLDFAKDNNVTEIYYCSSEFNDNTNNFIAKANSRGMSVHWLAGEYQWVENPSSLEKQMDNFVKYQNTHSNKFAGVHLDIEPHQHEEFDDIRQELITKLVELSYNIKNKYPTIFIDYDLPYWLEDEVILNGVTKPAYAHILDNASRITLMSYRDTAEKIYKTAEAELNYAKSINKPINLGVETKSNEGNHVSFQEEGKQVMYAEIAKLREMLPSNYGVVIHQIKHWYDLKN